MIKTERILFRSLINQTPAPLLNESPSSRFEADKYLAHTFFLPERHHSPALMEREVQIMTAQMGLLSIGTAPAPPLEDFLSVPSRDKPKNTGQTLNSGGNFKCPVCTKGFGTDKAMFGHMRIHQDKGTKGFKKPSTKNPNPKAIPGTYLCNLTARWTVTKTRSPRDWNIPLKVPEARHKPDLCKLTASWTVTKARSTRLVANRKIPRQAAASILIDMSKSTWDGQSKKTGTAESTPSEEDREVATILINMPNLIQNCQNQKRRIPESAWKENKKRRIEELTLSEDRKYVCLICDKTFPSHQALGGHCSSHKMQRKNGVSLESTELQSGDMKENFDSKMKSGHHVCEKCGKGFSTGQKLGGHKRAHYKKADLHDQK